MTDMTQKERDDAAVAQAKKAREEEAKAAEAHQDAAKEHGKQAVEEASKSKS
jgi:hypothetical protein